MILTSELKSEVRENVQNLPPKEELLWLNKIGQFPFTEADYIDLKTPVLFKPMGSFTQPGAGATPMDFNKGSYTDRIALQKQRMKSPIDLFTAHVLKDSQGIRAELAEKSSALVYRGNRRLEYVATELFYSGQTSSIANDEAQWPALVYPVPAGNKNILVGNDKWSGGSTMNPPKDVIDIIANIKLVAHSFTGPFRIIISPEIEAYLRTWIIDLKEGDLNFNNMDRYKDSVMNTGTIPPLWGISEVVVYNGTWQEIDTQTGTVVNTHRYIPPQYACIQPIALTGDNGFLTVAETYAEEMFEDGLVRGKFSKTVKDEDSGKIWTFYEWKSFIALTGYNRIGWIKAY